jgi:hypothetical protein
LSASYGADTTPTGIEVAEREAFRVYPNPVSDWLTIEGHMGPFEIYACASGALVQRIETRTIDVSGWAPGIYAVRTGNGLMKRFTVIP